MKPRERPNLLEKSAKMFYLLTAIPILITILFASTTSELLEISKTTIMLIMLTPCLITVGAGALLQYISNRQEAETITKGKQTND